MYSAEEFVAYRGEPARIAWAISYADLITLLLTFFVCLISMSRISSARYEAFARVFNRVPERGLHDIQREIEQVLHDEGFAEHVRTELRDDGLYVELENSVLFHSGDAELTEEARNLLMPIGQRLTTSLDAQYQLVVEGYTDDVPIHNARFHSNWELSTSRAIYVMARLVEAGFDPKRISVQGFADTRARIPPEESEDLTDARAASRRVVLRVIEVFEEVPHDSVE